MATCVFEVGKSYEAYDTGYSPITILRRTDKTVWVTNGSVQWKMRIRTDRSGNEIVTDSSVPPKWRDAFTYNSKWEYK